MHLCGNLSLNLLLSIEKSSNALSLLWSKFLNTLNFLSILEDDDCWELLDLEVFLCGWELVDVDFPCDGVVGVASGGSDGLLDLLFYINGVGDGGGLLFSLWWDFAGVCVDEDVFLLGLESLHEVLLGGELLVCWDSVLDLDGGHFG